jgi:NAD(P)-dependent dehydrogenase (short-subunit alcohol dehydrogenase family)
LKWCKKTTVSLDTGRRVVIMHDDGGVGEALAARLAARGVDVLSLRGPCDAATIEAEVQAWQDGGPIAGVFWLAALDPEPPLESIDLRAFRELTRHRVKNLAVAMRKLYDTIAGPGTFLLAATRMGGLHGAGAEGATAPIGGAVAGFAKAYKRERPEALVKVVDTTLGAPADEIATRLVDETLADPGGLEVGYREGLRWTLALEERPAADGQQGLVLDARSVFVVTGAAGAITSAIIADLAAASGGRFYLLDVAPAPSMPDPHVATWRAGRDALKSTLIDEARARGERPTPVQIERELLAIERREAAQRAIEAIEAAGGSVVYRSLDLRDEAAVIAVVDEIRARERRIDVLLHAGGIEISHPLCEKPAEEFDRVFDVKADGFFNLLRAGRDLPIAATVAFGSVAGRFGNAGQTDYASANALLASMSRALRRSRPGTRAIVLDWTAWRDVGMASRGSIPKMMEAAGIEMLPPEIGVPTVRRELTAGGTADEIVVGGSLGVLLHEWDSTGGLDLVKVGAALAAREQPLVMIGSVRGAFVNSGLQVETTLDPARQPFLFDHRIDGTPVLPGVMGTEAFAEMASMLCPDRLVQRVEDVRFDLPFKFYRDQPATLHLSAVGHLDSDGTVLVHVMLQSVVQPRPELPAHVRTHFTGRVRMAAQPETTGVVRLGELAGGASELGREAIYRIYFHGPSYQVLDGVSVAERDAIGIMAPVLPPEAQPAHAAMLMAPRLIELCFQTAGAIELSTSHRLALPVAVRSVAVYRQPEPEPAAAARLQARVHANPSPSEFDGEVVDEAGHVYVELRGYRTVGVPEAAAV